MSPHILVGTTGGLYGVNDNRSVQFAGHAVNALAHSDSRWWAILDRKEVWQSDAIGSWTKVATTESLRANCLLPTATGLLVGTSEAHLFALRSGTLESVRSFDTVPGRQEWHNPGGSPPDVRSMAAELADSVYVNVHVGGIVRSTDGGRSWTPTIDVHADVHQVLYDPGTGLLLAAAARGLAVSPDRGETWRFDTTGLHGRYLRAVAVANGTILITASTGPFTRQAAVYRKPLQGSQPFERCREGLPEWFPDNINTLCLAALGSWVAFGTATGEVFLSSDEGQHWSAEAEGLPPVRCVVLA
jgi:photosystem II stability/assembly factor-like uncharacterized protein